MVEKINIGVVGVGYWGTKLIREYAEISKERDDIKLVGVCDTSKERLERAMKECCVKTCKQYLDFDEMLKDGQINAVHIATPNKTHFELSMKAIDAGKHVILEKPMTLRSRDAFKLARHAESKNIALLVDHIFRFNNALRKVREIIQSRKYGEVNYIRLNWSAYAIPKDERDIIFDLAPHPIDITNYLLDEWPLRVYAIGESYVRKQKGMEEVAFILCELPSDVMTEITLSWIDHGPKKREVYIVMEKASVVVDALNQNISIYSGKSPINVDVEVNNTIRDMILHFIDYVKNRAAPLNSAMIGAMSVFTLEKIKESFDSKKAVRLMVG